MRQIQSRQYYAIMHKKLDKLLNASSNPIDNDWDICEYDNLEDAQLEIGHLEKETFGLGTLTIVKAKTTIEVEVEPSCGNCINYEERKVECHGDREYYCTCKLGFMVGDFRGKSYLYSLYEGCRLGSFGMLDLTTGKTSQWTFSGALPEDFLDNLPDNYIEQRTDCSNLFLSAKKIEKKLEG